MYCNERIYSVWFWFVCSFPTFTLSHSGTYANAQATTHTFTHTQAHAQWCYSFYSGVEVFSQYSIGSCTYVYFVMTLASYDWIFVFFPVQFTHASHTHIQSNIHETYVRFCSLLLLFVFRLFFVRTACNYGFKPVTIHNFFSFGFDEFLFLHALKQSTTGTNEWGKKQPTCWTTINHTTYACTHNELHNFDDSHNFWFCDEWKAKPLIVWLEFYWIVAVWIALDFNNLWSTNCNMCWNVAICGVWLLSHVTLYWFMHWMRVLDATEAIQTYAVEWSSLWVGSNSFNS